MRKCISQLPEHLVQLLSPRVEPLESKFITGGDLQEAVLRRDRGVEFYCLRQSCLQQGARAGAFSGHGSLSEKELPRTGFGRKQVEATAREQRKKLHQESTRELHAYFRLS